MEEEKIEKKCFKCGKTKLLKYFYKHPQMADGHLNKCIKCNKDDVRKNYRGNIDHYKDYEKKREADPDRKFKKSEYQRRYRKNNFLKYKAREQVASDIRSGNIKRQSCKYCGDPNTQAHHSDYNKPLDVTWVCFKCHREKFHNQENVETSGK